MKDVQFVKNYFRGKDTVARWWNPTEDDYAHIYRGEERIVRDWFQRYAQDPCLEVSCGKGRITAQLSPLSQEYIASDISEQMLALARTQAPAASFCIEDAEQLSFSDESMSTIVCLEALVHYPSPRKALEEFHRVLRKDGLLIIDADNAHSLRRRVKSLFGQQELGRDIFQPYTKKEFTGMLHDAGFSIEHFAYVGVISPIRIHKEKTFYVVSPQTSERLQFLYLDAVPGINRLATYHLALARKS
ncbi:MAG: class I SAM-dependent methyltransferase [archaeon]